MSNKRPAPDVEVNSTVVPDADDFKVIIITEVTNVAELDPTIGLNKKTVCIALDAVFIQKFLSLFSFILGF